MNSCHKARLSWDFLCCQIWNKSACMRHVFDLGFKWIDQVDMSVKLIIQWRNIVYIHRIDVSESQLELSFIPPRVTLFHTSTKTSQQRSFICWKNRYAGLNIPLYVFVYKKYVIRYLHMIGISMAHCLRYYLYLCFPFFLMYCQCYLEGISYS